MNKLPSVPVVVWSGQGGAVQTSTQSMFKQGEKLVRFCERKRNESYTAIHEFTIWSGIFVEKDVPPHIQRLFKHLSKAFAYGVPQRDKSSSKGEVIEDLEWNQLDTDLLQHARMAEWQGMGKQQHPILQNYLAENDPLTIALEAPVWDNDCNGFIDILRIHDDYRIEIADFKPNAAKEKKAPSQLTRYKNMLCECANIDEREVFCTWFDHESAFILL